MRAIPLLLLAVLFALLAAGDASGQLNDKQKKILQTFADEFVVLTPGKGKFPAAFQMGSSADKAPAAEKPAVKVTLKKPFAMAKYEVTQELYELVMGKNPAKWRGVRNSVEMVTWDEANTFCAKATTLLRKEKLIGEKDVVRLPSEAEWEYACRAGTKTAWSFGDDVKEIGTFSWYDKNSPGNDPPVGRKKPTAWGLYAMHGYVSEWCADDWHDSLKDFPADGSPRKKTDEKDRVIRGGSFADAAEKHRSAYRDHKPADHKSDRVGFRCAKAKEVEK
jgi:formylglycine-generating enzyme required for sulfatase activity